MANDLAGPVVVILVIAAVGIAMTGGTGASTTPSDGGTTTSGTSGTSGTVSQADALTARTGPSLHAGAASDYAADASVQVSCFVHGSQVDGTDRWFLATGTGNWVSARYVAPGGTPDRACTGSGTLDATTTEQLAQRSGPTTSDTLIGYLDRGTTLGVVCRVSGETIDGNSTWLYTTTGHWVSGRYLTVASTPDACH